MTLARLRSTACGLALPESGLALQSAYRPSVPVSGLGGPSLEPELKGAVSVLFARRDSIYKTFSGVDVFDIDRDATTFTGTSPVICHPPCRAWGRLRYFAKPRLGEKELAFFAVEQVRKNGGVLEHPSFSTLWPAAELPLPGQYDRFGGFTLPIHQYQFGHRAQKSTWLYICGLVISELPPMPFVLGAASCVVETRKKSDPRPSITKAEREQTPVDLAIWLLKICTYINDAKGGAKHVNAI